MQRLNILLITIFLFFSAYDSQAQTPEIGDCLRLSHIYFKRGTSALLPTSIPLLNEFANFMKKYSKVMIRLEGHTDNLENPKHNMELSENRAKVVKKYLVEQGITENRIELKGYGDTKPLANDQGKKAIRRLNRRVEFVVIEK
jgi:outer membrane protein OmpA-like peptidoglycan-associated protein